MAFIEMRTDSFAKNLKDQTRQSVAATPVRRPLRGIEIKDDRYATIRIRRADGTDIPLTDAGSLNGASSGTQTPAGSGIAYGGYTAPKSATSVVYSNFIIESIEDSRQEKAQIMETFGEPYVFFFGERPRVLQVSGILFNTLDFNWRTEFWENYEKRLRGTKLVEQNARMYLHWDDIVVEGYTLGAQASEVADMPYHVRFSFTLFVTNHTYLSAINSEDGAFPMHMGAPNPDTIAGIATDPNYAGTLNGTAATKGIASLMNIGTAAGLALTATSLAKATGMATGTNTKTKFTGLDIAKQAVGLGLFSASMTFMNVVSEYFRNKKIAHPKRTLKWRTKINDNFDEYLKNGEMATQWSPAYDEDYIRYMQIRQQSLDTYYKVSSVVQTTLTATGIDPLSTTANVLKNPFTGRAHVMATTGKATSNVTAWNATKF
ncbi:hypothetical protein UFOVP276_144 [uncultured Caudovirales phage]|uniref:Uncharacterized protein n=1 Tax=uncultured Caudovirales phage TaxID=2100421 RepID=A0A6J5LKR8_9CAUD|nr:hypothetical protein UFOVP127_38 [uncultured Caudovirales phage]CAB4135188.1 hypothetical protein UFOVP276_144 [uncultured Caudovirales phage]